MHDHDENAITCRQFKRISKYELNACDSHSTRSSSIISSCFTVSSANSNCTGKSLSLSLSPSLPPSLQVSLSLSLSPCVPPLHFTPLACLNLYDGQCLLRTKLVPSQWFYDNYLVRKLIETSLWLSLYCQTCKGQPVSSQGLRGRSNEYQLRYFCAS